MPITSDQVLDCRDLLCPLPVIKTNKAIETLRVGEVLEMLATDPGAKLDMPAWAKHTGHELLEVQEDGQVLRFFFRKTR